MAHHVVRRHRQSSTRKQLRSGRRHAARLQLEPDRGYPGDADAEQHGRPCEQSKHGPRVTLPTSAGRPESTSSGVDTGGSPDSCNHIGVPTYVPPSDSSYIQITRTIIEDRHFQLPCCKTKDYRRPWVNRLVASVFRIQ